MIPAPLSTRTDAAEILDDARVMRARAEILCAEADLCAPRFGDVKRWAAATLRWHATRLERRAGEIAAEQLTTPTPMEAP